MNTLKVKDTVFQPGRPKVAVSITGTEPRQIVDECEFIKTLPCEVIEWRADYYLSSLGNLEEKLQEKETYIELLKVLDDINFVAEEMPVIFTLRTESQGGTITLDVDEMEDILSLVWESGFADFIDIELPENCSREDEERIRSWIEQIHENNGRVIMSYHAFDRMLDVKEIVERISLMKGLGADMYKVAAMAFTREDAEMFLKTTAYLTKKKIGPIVMMAMGEWGKTTRVAGGKYGSCITFAAGKEQSAPGQVDTYTMKKWLDDYYGEEK